MKNTLNHFMILLCVAAIVIQVNICHAFIPQSKLSLGGVYFQMPYEEVINLYPSDVQFLYGSWMADQNSQYFRMEGNSFSLNYPNKVHPTFKTTFMYGMAFNGDVITGTHRLNDTLLPDAGIYVSNVLTSANNGIETPSGAYVGMTVNELLALYGNPDHISQFKNRKNFVYFGDDKNGLCLYFSLENGTVTSIRLWDYYGGTAEASQVPFVIKSLND